MNSVVTDLPEFNVLPSTSWGYSVYFEIESEKMSTDSKIDDKTRTTIESNLTIDRKRYGLSSRNLYLRITHRKCESKLSLRLFNQKDKVPSAFILEADTCSAAPEHLDDFTLKDERDCC
uniref:Uncharacterized protein n=1 Tax=Glossina palpalis gambiensis TaxID=67801 RepID=A0A1B0AM13_9MUSC